MQGRSDNPLAANVRLGHSLGWSFTPLAGKRPVLKAWQKRPRETLQEALDWASRGNVGLRTGRISGVVVIDVDEGGDPESLGLPPTVTARTGGNGTHFYYRYEGPLGNSSGKLGPHIDVRADGGQVVFAGSVHPETGRAYEWMAGRSPGELPLTELPPQIIERLQTKAPADRPTSLSSMPLQLGRRSQRYSTTVLEREIAALRRAPEGTRNDTLNKAAFRLGTLIGGGALDRSVAEMELLAVAEAIGLGQGESRATIRSGVESGMEHPRDLQSRACDRSDAIPSEGATEACRADSA
jgi:hypothetical protein